MKHVMGLLTWRHSEIVIMYFGLCITLCRYRNIGKNYLKTISRGIEEDHIHTVVRSEPKISPSDIMKIIKSLKAREFFKHYPEIKKQYFFWGGVWTQSYFVETIGNATEETIRAYVQNQLMVMDQLEITSKQINLF